VQAVTLVPLQEPPQADPSVAQAARPPWGAPVTAKQVPTWPATSQAWHWPPQAWSQQRPSTQKPLAHWPAALQAAPFAWRGTQAPPEQ
jgi:hypothetical protein